MTYILNNKQIGHLGIILTMVVALALFVYVAVSLARYDIMCCSGAENIRWRALDNKGLNTDDIGDLVFWGIYLTLTAITYILYFRQYTKDEGGFNKWVIPIFNIKRNKCLSVALSLVYVSMVICLSVLLPDYYMPFATLEDVEGLPDFIYTFDCYNRHSFDDDLLHIFFLYPFVIGHFVHLMIYSAMSAIHFAKRNAFEWRLNSIRIL